jgi:hypothetical protein
LRTLRTTAALALCLAAALAHASAQVPDLIKQNVDDASRIKLPGTVHPLVGKSTDQGRVSGSLPLQRMVLLLGRSSQQQLALDTLVASLQDKSSPNYHKWLTPEQFAAQFGVSDKDVATVSGWLTQHGLTVNSVARGRQWIEFSGTATQVETALGTEIHTLTYQDQKHIANVSAVSIPEALAPAVRGILSLNDFRKQANLQGIRNMKRSSSGQWIASAIAQSGSGKASANFTFDTGPNDEGVIYALAPGDLSTIYNTAPLLQAGTNGSGVSIAIVGRSDILISDVETYRKVFALPAQDPNIVINGSDPGDVTDDDIESTLDVEAAGAMAPNATINLVESASTNTSDGVDLSALYIVDNVLAPIMSTSYGACEAQLGNAGNALYNALWEQAAAEGITPLVAAGDQGGAACDSEGEFGAIAADGPAVNGLASTPYDVAVGGSEFNEGGAYGTYWNGANTANLSSAIGYIPETIWNESCNANNTFCPPAGLSIIAAGGGGQSSCAVQASNSMCISGYAKPAWQTGLGVPADGVRDIPDISLSAASAHDGYVLCFEGSCSTDTIGGQTYLTSFSEVGGTSASTPAFAGILSLIEQKNGAFQGQVDTTLYQLFAATDPTPCNSSNMTNPATASSCIFNDITTGNNATPDETGEAAGVGYDLASGIGSVNAANLVAAWSSATKLASATTASVSATSLTHGQPVNVTLAVKPATGTGVPTGDVALVAGSYGSGGFVTLAKGAATASVATLPGGSYNLTAQYAGDTHYAGSTSTPIALTVKPEAASVKLSSYTQTATGNDVHPPVASTTATFGAYLAIRADVQGKSGQGIPSGSVSFYDGSTLLGTVALNTEASATLPTGFAPITPVGPPIYLSVGTHTITVTYTGDNSFSPITASTAYVVTITKAPAIELITGTAQFYVPVGTSINVAATLNYSWTGTNVIAPPAPTGTIQFQINGTNIGSPQPIAYSSPNMGETPVPEAVLAYAFTSATSGAIGAVYSGDSNYLPANSYNGGYSVPVTVYSTGQKTPQVSMTATPAAPTLGQVVNYTVTVHPGKAGDPVPTGTISVWGAGVNYYTSLYTSYPLVNGVATFPTTATQAGTAITYASYSGDSRYSSAASPAISVPIARATPTLTLTTPSPYIALNTQTTFTATVVGDPNGAIVANALSGSVELFDAVNGAPAQPLGVVHALPGSSIVLPAILPAGTNVVTFAYLGDINWASATSQPVTVTVSSPDYQIAASNTTVDLSSGGTATVGLTITPILGFNQPIALTCGSGLPVGVTCAFSPATVEPSGAPVPVTLTLTSSGAYTSASNSKWVAGGASLSLAALACFLWPRRRRPYTWTALVLIAVTMGSMAGCGGSGKPTVSSMTLTSSAVKVASGQPVTLTAAVAGNGTAPTGSVTFLDGSTSLGSQSLGASASASLTTSALALGTHTITATYAGDKKHDPATASPVYEAITGYASVSITATAGTDTHTLPLTITMQ